MSAVDYQASTSLTAMFFEQAARFGDRSFLWRKINRQWTGWTWQQTAEQVNLLARGLTALGVKKGDRILLVSENRPEWLIADLAIMAAGAITVPAYTTNTVADHLHLMNNSGAKFAIVSTRPLAERVIGAALSADHAPLIITLEPLNLTQDPGVLWKSLDEVLTLGAAYPDRVADEVKSQRRTDTACLIYTSGTGGAPKGVMLSHGAILCNCYGAHQFLLQMGLDDEVFLSFLPLSHSYEHTAGQFFPISIGAQIYYAESVDQLSNNMMEVSPTLMTAVPRLYEMMRGRILHGIERTGGFKAKLFARTLALGTRRYECPDQLSLKERFLDRILTLLVRRKIAARFGGRLKAMVSGGAPLNYEVGLFFTALGIRILQGYGQTEAAPIISCTQPCNVRLHTVGQPVPGTTVKIAPDGEILVQGELVMQGYWGDDEATQAAIQNGWLHTGDIGFIDSEGNIQITDRKKDIIVNSGGDNISPQRVEGFLTLQPEIAQAMVYGDRRPHLVALLVPDADHATRWANQQGKSDTALEQLEADPAFRRHISEAVDRVNRSLSPIEKVRRFTMTAEPFTVANEMSTPTLKIRRHVIMRRYGQAFDELYESAS